MLDRSLHDESLVIDAHTHPTGMLPRAVDAGYRIVARPHPHDVPFGDLRASGVDAVVAKAVGDGVVTRWRWPASPWRAVLDQLASIREQSAAGGCEIAMDARAIAEARAAGTPAVVLGLEGGDVIGDDPGRVLDLHAVGVRVIGLIHYVDNALGTTCMPWQRWVPVPLPARRRRRPGLTPAGLDVLATMNECGVVADLAHADRATTLQACERTTAPLISSHTGARALQEFDRYVSDDEARAIAATGGLIGLWPFRYGGRGAADVDDWARHASYLGELVGPEHLCIGTDMNGVSGLMEGYDGEEDLPVLTDALRTTGFSDDEVRAIIGGNVASLLDAVCGSRQVR
ncbi:MAG: dipeptidase [Acidimicrobiales bacterium]